MFSRFAMEKSLRARVVMRHRASGLKAIAIPPAALAALGRKAVEGEEPFLRSIRCREECEPDRVPINIGSEGTFAVPARVEAFRQANHPSGPPSLPRLIHD
jgi:hypothetical protein